MRLSFIERANFASNMCTLPNLNCGNDDAGAFHPLWMLCERQFLTYLYGFRSHKSGAMLCECAPYRLLLYLHNAQHLLYALILQVWKSDTGSLPRLIIINRSCDIAPDVSKARSDRSSTHEKVVTSPSQVDYVHLELAEW